MKLTKISLAALVALGAFSSVASATPLEEAIKNVDLSGFARYRYTNTRNKSADASATPSQDRNNASHQFRMITNFKAAIDDNFFGVIGLRYNTLDGSGDNAGNGTDKTDTTTGFGVHQFYLGYKAGNTTITAGKQEIGSYFTNDAVATGIKIVNQDIEGLTLAAAAFDALEGNDESDGDLYSIVRGKNSLDVYDAGNLYAAAIMGSYSPIDFQLWYGSLTNLADVLAADVSGNFAITNDISLGARINYAHSQVDTSAKNALNYEDGNFYAGELSTSLYGFDLAAGYIGYKTQNYQDGKYSIFTFEDQGGLIDAGEDVLDWTRAKGKGSYFYATSAYTFDKFTAGLDYIKGSYKTDKKTKVEEFVPRFAYQYNKKLKFSSFYAFKTEKEHNGDKEKTDKFRFEAKYSF